MTKSVAADPENPAPFAGNAAGIIVLGFVVDLDDQGRPRVDFNGNPSPVPLVALTTSPINKGHISKQVALLFNNGDLSQPVIMGFIHNPLDELLENFELAPSEYNITDGGEEVPKEAPKQTEIKRQDDNQVYVDGKQVCIEGAEEVTFKCGKASITLMKSGKILIRGTYLLSRSTGVNRILGGSVQVN